MGSRRSYLKNRHWSFFLAVVVFGAVPAFADRVTFNFMDGDRDSVSMQEGSIARSFGRSTFIEEQLRGDTEFDRVARVSEFRRGDKISELGALINSGLDMNNPSVGLSDLDVADSDFLGSDSEDARGGREGRDRDRDETIVANTEPRSLVLLLFGLAVLSVGVCWRNSEARTH
jgi:hypothetical protein